MQNKGILIGTFVKKNKILSFLETLKYEFKTDLGRVFVYTINTNKYEYLVTFKTFDKDIFMGHLPNATVLHVKNGCLFSINALNTLIDKMKADDKPNNEYVVDWNEYKDKLIIKTNGEFSMSSISKIEDFMTFFK